MDFLILLLFVFYCHSYKEKGPMQNFITVIIYKVTRSCRNEYSGKDLDWCFALALDLSTYHVPSNVPVALGLKPGKDYITENHECQGRVGIWSNSYLKEHFWEGIYHHKGSNSANRTQVRLEWGKRVEEGWQIWMLLLIMTLLGVFSFLFLFF